VFRGLQFLLKRRDRVALRVELFARGGGFAACRVRFTAHGVGLAARRGQFLAHRLGLAARGRQFLARGFGVVARGLQLAARGFHRRASGFRFFTRRLELGLRRLHLPLRRLRRLLGGFQLRGERIALANRGVGARHRIGARAIELRALFLGGFCRRLLRLLARRLRRGQVALQRRDFLRQLVARVAVLGELARVLLGLGAGGFHLALDLLEVAAARGRGVL